MRIYFILLFLFSSLLAQVNITISHKNIKHGTTFAVILQSDTKLTQAPNVIFKNKIYQMFTILGSTKKYEVFIPVDYYAKLQKENIQVKYKQNNKVIKKTLSLTIVDGKYKKNEIISVPNGKVVLSKKNKIRSKKEYDIVYKKVYSVINRKDYIKKSNFRMPLQAKITSAFGNARVYNGKTKSYHSGSDFRAKTGTKIYASNDGRVALVMNRFYLGNVIYIDHGRGAYSYYCHLNSFNVKENQLIRKGDLIAFSGATGRITGPHLHYAVRLYNTTVDPLQFGSLYNRIIKEYY